MKCISMILATCAFALLPHQGSAQAAVYGEFSASQLTGGPAGDYLYGGTAGVIVRAGSLGPHINLLADVQGRFVTKSGEGLDAVNVGPRLAFPFHHLAGLTPYAEFLAGFARYHDMTQNGPTDSMIQANGGVTRPLNKHLDIVVDYGWARYGAFQNMYNPQTFSTGLVYNFTR